MPYAELADGKVYYRVDGPHQAPVVVLSNSLGTDLSMWNRQVAVLANSFRVLRYDGRGHGASLETPGPYTIKLLAQDVVSLLDRLEIASAHFCGLSLGGMVGMWLAANVPARVNKLVLANTSADASSRAAWDARIAAVELGGMSAVASAVLERWFTPAFREHADAQAVQRTLLATSPSGYIACCAAIREMDLRSDLLLIQAPTLIIAGEHDPATPPAMCRQLANAIVGARYIELPAAHLSNIEAVEAFNAATLDFLLT